MARTKGGLSLEIDGLQETLKAFQQLDRELERPAANAELRDAADTCAGQLAVALRQSAASSGVPVAPRVAQSIKVKRDRLPVIAIGGGMRVGRNGGSASALVWGSEQGPKGEVNHFAVPPAAGYWIAPAVDRFSRGPAISNYQRAVFDLLKKYDLI